LEAVRGVLAGTINPQLPGMAQVSRPSDALAAKRAAQNTFSALSWDGPGPRYSAAASGPSSAISIGRSSFRTALSSAVWAAPSRSA